MMSQDTNLNNLRRAEGLIGGVIASLTVLQNEDYRTCCEQAGIELPTLATLREGLTQATTLLDSVNLSDDQPSLGNVVVLAAYNNNFRYGNKN